MPEQALSDVRILDLTRYITGPYCAKLLGDYGADVTKVERPGTGDPARSMGPFFKDDPHPEKSGLFLYLNTNKKSITLNLKSGWGRTVVRELVKDTDILVESFRPGVMEKLGLGYQELKEINPRLVMTSISNFGQWGPYRDFKATEIVIFAMGGPMLATGRTGREPLKYYDSVSSYQIALDATIATMACLRHARRTGVGQQIDLSMFEALLSSIDRRGTYTLSWEYCQRLETYRVTASAGGVMPQAGYACKDGYIQFTWTMRQHWPRFCRWIGRPELLEDPKFATVEQRMQPEQMGVIEAFGASFLMDHTMAELMESMEEHQIPGGCVYSVADVVADAQMQHRQFFVEIDHPVAGKFRYPGAPARPLETPWQAGRAPLLGEHNEEVYCGRLGYSKEDLVRLREQGVI